MAGQYHPSGACGTAVGALEAEGGFIELRGGDGVGGDGCDSKKEEEGWEEGGEMHLELHANTCKEEGKQMNGTR